MRWHVAPEGGRLIPLIGRLKVSGSGSGGAFELYEFTGPATPPPHIHREHQEVFHVLGGTFMFVVEDEQVEAAAGSTVFVPRGTRHGFTTSEGARALLLVVPAGLEGFFRDLGEGLAGGRSGIELRAALAGRFDSEPA
jgi:quercetin dioxygenase-like cupin family protein